MLIRLGFWISLICLHLANIPPHPSSPYIWPHAGCKRATKPHPTKQCLVHTEADYSSSTSHLRTWLNWEFLPRHSLRICGPYSNYTLVEKFICSSFCNPSIIYIKYIFVYCLFAKWNGPFHAFSCGSRAGGILLKHWSVENKSNQWLTFAC